MDKNRKQEYLKCEIVQDLLPLYYDMVTNETTNEAVRNHLEQCESCRKEYDLMGGELPVEAEEVSTKKKFDKVAKRQKKFWLEIVVVAVLVTGVISALYYSATMGILKIPVSGGEDMSVQHIYRYTDEYGYYNYYIQYTCTSWDGITGKIDVKKNNYGDVLSITFERPVNSKKYDIVSQDVLLYGSLLHCDSGDLNTEVEKNDFDAIEFDGKIVWTREENGKDTVPEYVYVYDELRRQEVGMRKTVNGENLVLPGNTVVKIDEDDGLYTEPISEEEVVTIIPREEEIVRFTMNRTGNEGEYLVEYRNGYVKRWDNEGKVIYEGFPYNDKESYMGYEN